MADSSLDDFFAKKDKSKKSKKKNLTTDEIAKKLEESGKKSEKLRKNIKEKTNQTVLNTNTSEQEDEEWNDFEEEREKDYSGLRIQTLTIKDKEEEFREQQMQDIDEENKKESQSGPWKLSTPSSGSTPNEEEKTSEDVVNEIVSGVSVVSSGQTQGSGKYVPPHLRNVPQTQTTLTPTSLSSTKRSKAGAPKIADTTEFPSLGTPTESSEDIKGFQTVKHGNRDICDRSSTQVELNNKYGLLNTNKELQNNSD
jgi:hypothetical protein